MDNLRRDGELRPIRTLSLFSGAGGLDIGFHEAGFDIIAAVEIEEAYCATLRANTGAGRFFGPRLTVHCEDIRLFDATPYSGGQIECVIGGPPCQTFSAAGRRSGGVLGTDDLRGQLFRAYCDVLSVVQPQVFVFENVYGLPGANGGEPWREIVAAFSALGYYLEYTVVDAADYGVPQHRERLFMVGTRRGGYRFPMPTHGPDSVSGLPFVSVNDAIWDLQNEDEPENAGPGGRYGHLLPLIPPGLNYSFFTAEMGYPQPVFAWRSKFHDFLYKTDPNTPSRTIKARPGKFTGPFHWKNRHFTAAELKRLQSFPDDYELRGSFDRVVEQIGNSVPPGLANAIARSVRAQLLGGPDALDLPPRPDDFASTFRRRQRERTHHFHRVAEAEIARRFGAADDPALETLIDEESYWLTASGFFQNEMHHNPPEGQDPRDRVFKVGVSRDGEHVALLMERQQAERHPGRTVVTITGLSKYLDSIESLSAVGHLGSPEDLFTLWAEIERALVSRSEFFTLIDIYGHYANRGDTVRVLTEPDVPTSPDLLRALRFFGRSENCGDLVERSTIRDALQLADTDLDELVSAMRELRWDVRTNATHPTMAQGQLLCTYPFPLLSEKAHVSRKVSTLATPAA